MTCMHYPTLSLYVDSLPNWRLSSATQLHGLSQDQHWTHNIDCGYSSCHGKFCCSSIQMTIQGEGHTRRFTHVAIPSANVYTPAKACQLHLSATDIPTLNMIAPARGSGVFSPYLTAILYTACTNLISVSGLAPAPAPSSPPTESLYASICSPSSRDS